MTASRGEKDSPAIANRLRPVNTAYGNGQLILADGKLVITAEKGFIALVRADPADHAELGRCAVFADRTWNVPALAGRRLYMRNHRELACVELPGSD
jgi:outer membrane protein assembly factor BamB